MGINLFKPRIQDAKRAAEKIPGMGAKLAGLPWELLLDALVSIQMSIYQLTNLELWKQYHDNELDWIMDTRKDVEYARAEIAESKVTLENVAAEVMPQSALGYKGFRADTEESFADVDKKLDDIYNLLSLAAGDIEQIPKTPPPPPPTDEICKALSAALQALAKKEFRVDYKYIETIVTRTVKPILDKANQVDARVIPIAADVKTLLRRKGTDDEDTDYSKAIANIAKELKEIHKLGKDTHALLDDDIKGEVLIPDCDPKKKPQKVPYQGKGMAGLLSFHKASGRLLEAIKEQSCNISGGNQPLPETWHGKALDNIPSLVLSFAVVRKDGKKTSANYDVTIPHYNGAVKPRTPPIASIKKGNYYGIVTLKDGTKATTYCESQAEAAKFINAALRIIPKEWHKSPIDTTIGIRTNVKRTRQTIVCKHAAYYAEGRKSPYPAWTVSF